MLLDSNSQFLQVITDMEEKLRGQQVFGMSYVRDQSARAIFPVLRMIKNLDDLSNHRYAELFEVLEKIKINIFDELGQKKELPPIALTLPYAEINKEMVDWVGGKSANLGEIHSQLHLPIPEGFAITTSAFALFVSHRDLSEDDQQQENDDRPHQPGNHQPRQPGNPTTHPFRRSAGPLEEAIRSAYNQLAQRINPGGSKERSPKIAMRSSAIGEDSELSFAGQYRSVLNVDSDQLIPTYKEIVASLYTPRAMAYRLNKGIRDEDIAMGVACLEMIDSRASGVIYTHDPLNPLEDTIAITAVWGLGPYAVEGRITPDSYTVAKDRPFALLASAISPKPIQLINDPEGGVKEIPVPSEDQDIPCLSPDQIGALAEYARQLETHYKNAQDIEWALDQKRAIPTPPIPSPPRLLRARGAKNPSPDPGLSSAGGSRRHRLSRGRVRVRSFRSNRMMI